MRLTTLLLLIGLVLLPVGAGALGAAPAPESQKETVTLIVDYGDGVQKHFTNLSWRRGMTVLDAMRAAEKHGRGVKIKYQGSGSTALLTKIDDLANRGGRGANWIYRVGGKLANRSIGIYKLQAGDTIVWKYSKFQF